MVSPLWKACAEGRLDEVHELLADATSVDIEVKDHTGATPLIEAVKNGHYEVVSALLEKGADPNNGSSLGPPLQHTSDPAIIDLLVAAQNRIVAQPIHYENGYDANADESAKVPYYSATYPYYPTLNSAQPPPEGGVYYPPPPNQPSVDGMPGGPGHLPPAEIARYIPCRYFPACRYGASCMFLHPPPQGAYYQGPMHPQAQYPPYDPMGPQGYAPNYYPPPPSFSQPNGVSVNPLASPPPMGHGRSPSMGPVPPQFSPNGHPVPLPYMSPMMSPTAYAHPGQVPVPMSIAPLPPLQHSVPPPQQSPQANYSPLPPPPQSYPVPANGAYYPSQPPIPVNYSDMNGSTKSPSLNPQQDAFVPAGPRENGHQRRGSTRRGSFVNQSSNRKPPCLFYPSGRCKNGDDCRFPHVLPEGAPAPGAYFNGARGGGPRSRGHQNANGFGTIDQKMAAMSIRDDHAPRYQNGDGVSRLQSTDANRTKYNGGYKNGPNGYQNKRGPPPMKQRVPNADEFPVLAGSITPPVRSASNGSLSTMNGGAPTAAQVLQAPPPSRPSEGSAGSVSPDLVRPIKDENPSEPSPVPPQPTKPPISFAAVAAPEMIKEVQVSA